jgi:hypothetical protein
MLKCLFCYYPKGKQKLQFNLNHCFHFGNTWRMANVSGFVVNCLGTKSIALENRKLKYSSRQSLGTVSRYFVSRKMKWNTWPQKLATDSSSSATSRCCVAASRWVTCQLRVLVASPARDLLQLFHQATTDDRKVFGFQFLQNVGNLILSTTLT